MIASFTMAGSIIGAGILGLPYVFSQSGYAIGLFWIIFLGAILLFANLSLGEVILRTRGHHQLSGYAEKYLGKNGKKIMFFAVLFAIYSALIAYLIGEGQSLSKFFTGTLDYAILFGFLFWIFLTLLLRKGLEGLKKIESFGVSGIIIIIIFLFFWLAPDYNMNNVSYINFPKIFTPFGVTLFALLGMTCIPEVRREIKGHEKLLKKSILVGSIIPVILYAIFSFAFVAVLGKNVSEVATLSFGKLIDVVGIFTMFTSYLVLSFALKDLFEYDLHKKKLGFFFVTVLPFLLYLFISYFHIASFSSVLGVAGIISGGLIGSLVLIMNIRAKNMGNRKPEYVVPINWFIIGFIIFVFACGAIMKLVF